MTPTDDTGSGGFSAILPGLLRPLVRLLIARGVTFPMLQRLLKEVYVASAAADFSIDGAPPTDSRISLLTGVHRRDVRTLRNAPDTFRTTRKATTLLATVIGRWLADPIYRMSDGTLMPLARQSQTDASFETLVRSVNRDLRPRTVLDELIRQKLVTEQEDGMLVLDENATIGPADHDAKLVFFAENIGDHLRAAAANLETDPAPFFERAVFYNRLSEDSIALLDGKAREKAQKLLLDLNALAAERQKSDVKGGIGTGSFRLGIFMMHGHHPNQLRDDEGSA